MANVIDNTPQENQIRTAVGRQALYAEAKALILAIKGSITDTDRLRASRYLEEWEYDRATLERRLVEYSKKEEQR